MRINDLRYNDSRQNVYIFLSQKEPTARQQHRFWFHRHSSVRWRKGRVIGSKVSNDYICARQVSKSCCTTLITMAQLLDQLHWHRVPELIRHVKANKTFHSRSLLTFDTTFCRFVIRTWLQAEWHTFAGHMNRSHATDGCNETISKIHSMHSVDSTISRCSSDPAGRAKSCHCHPHEKNVWEIGLRFPHEASEVTSGARWQWAKWPNGK